MCGVKLYVFYVVCVDFCTLNDQIYIFILVEKTHLFKKEEGERNRPVKTYSIIFKNV